MPGDTPYCDESCPSEDHIHINPFSTVFYSTTMDMTEGTPWVIDYDVELNNDE